MFRKQNRSGSNTTVVSSDRAGQTKECDEQMTQVEDTEPYVAIEKLLLKKYGDVDKALEQVKKAETRLRQIKGDNLQ